MADLPLDRPAGVLVKTTCVDFPGHLAGSFFLKGCNLRCPYCYNRDLVLGFNDDKSNGESSESHSSQNTIEELFNHLEKRQGILTGLTISGGEPLLNPYTPIIIKKAKELGYLIKLDTNGTLPDELEALLNDKELRPDFIAMDIKTSPSRYATEICNKTSPFFAKTEYWEKKVKRCTKLVASYPAEKREFRTVLVPPLVQKEDIKKMAGLLPQDASWQFAQFRNENCLDPSYNEIPPYTDSEVAELIEYAQTFIKGAELR
ncbi:MAG: radical SAM protein [Treponema sp.]|nr:radical SAM protein [Treponema sp.]